jgi:DNA-binding transcriptional LysR family regulator
MRPSIRDQMQVRRLGFDLQALEIFAVVCRTGSMTATAAQTDLTQSAVSRHVLNLERRLGVTLLARGSRPLKPTSSGRKLAGIAERLIAEAIGIPAQLRIADAGMIPQLRLGLIDSLSEPLAAMLIKSLRDRVETISVATGFMSSLRERVLNHELDAVVSADPFDDVDGFEHFELFCEHFVVVAPSGAPAFADEAGFRHFATHLPMIRSGTATGIAIRVEQHLRRLRLEVPRTFSCDTIESIIGLVASGVGWSLLTPVCVRKCIALAPALQLLQLPGAGFTRRGYLVVRRGEFGRFPRQLAATCRRAIQRSYIPPLVAIAPWMARAITVSEPSGAELP